MACLDRNGQRVHYRVDGVQGPWLLLCNSLGTDLHMWDRQMAALTPHFRVLRYDRRGHGASSTPPAPYTLADLGLDVLALLDALEIGRVNFCGLSLGGLVGQWLGVYAPERIATLTVCATASRIGTAQGWQERISQVSADGLAALAQATAQRWFTDGFNTAHGAVVQPILRSFAAVSVEGYIGCCAALAAADMRTDIAAIAAPVLAISGADDPVCPPLELQFIADTVRQGRHVSLPGRHLVNVESAQAFNAVLLEFLDRRASDSAHR